MGSGNSSEGSVIVHHSPTMDPREPEPRNSHDRRHRSRSGGKRRKSRSRSRSKSHDSRDEKDYISREDFMGYIHDTLSDFEEFKENRGEFVKKTMTNGDFFEMIMTIFTHSLCNSLLKENPGFKESFDKVAGINKEDKEYLDFLDKLYFAKPDEIDSDIKTLKFYKNKRIDASTMYIMWLGLSLRFMATSIFRGANNAIETEKEMITVVDNNLEFNTEQQDRVKNVISQISKTLFHIIAMINMNRISFDEARESKKGKENLGKE